MSEINIIEELENIVREQDDELAVWRRHGVLVTEDCPINGAGCQEMHEATLGTGPCPCGSGFGRHRCKVCDGSGKVLKDGAVRSNAFGLERVSFPASWLEGASDV